MVLAKAFATPQVTSHTDVVVHDKGINFSQSHTLVCLSSFSPLLVNNVIKLTKAKDV